MIQRNLIVTAMAALGLGLAGQAQAIPGSHPFVGPGCDALPPITLTHELGELPHFPLDEAIKTVTEFTNNIACIPAAINLPGPNFLVTMDNLSPTAWRDVYFVADPDYAISNFDGTIKGGLAFRIDHEMINTPLVFESMAFDGIFEIGETWKFIVQGWTPLGAAPLLPPLFGSDGVGVDSLPGSPGDPSGIFSTASIVAIPVPEPQAWGMMAVGLGLVGWMARRKSI
jgi:hypothetical protein